MIKKLKNIYKAALIIGLPVSLYVFVYATNVERPQVASTAVAALPIAPLAVTEAKPVTLAENTKPVVKKPVVKKAPAKKKVVKKKKKKERLIPAPALITAETAPHSGR